MTGDEAIVEQLAFFFRRNGYVRRQNHERLASEGRRYKKGDEIRLVAETQAELRTIRRLLRQAGFKPGHAFAKHEQYCQPVYGRRAVAHFLTLIGEAANA